jgi:hypothetical protein
MTNQEQWLSAIRSVRGSIKSANSAVAELARWIDQNVVAHDVRPRSKPPALEAILKILHDALISCESIAAEIDDNATRTMLRCFGGRRLTREEYYLIHALDPQLLDYTNKSSGLSSFDDYEVFSFYCYESKDECGYISPSHTPRSPPVVHDLTTTIAARVGPMLAPEDVSWSGLLPEQRTFFERYCPAVAKRFRRP